MDGNRIHDQIQTDTRDLQACLQSRDDHGSFTGRHEFTLDDDGVEEFAQNLG